MSETPTTTRQIQTLVTDAGTVELTLAETDLGPLGDAEVIVAIEASPINPSDLGVLLAGADNATLRGDDGSTGPMLVADLSEPARRAAAARTGHPLPAGNEGAGTVVAAGASEAAQALLGRTVAVLGGGMYAEHRRLPAGACVPLPDGTTAAAGASCFVNPLTVLGMVETMELEGHSALVHTAAASNLGQMLNRLCLERGIGLVNIVRRPAQVDLLRSEGATHVVDTSAEGWRDDLVAALVDTGATIAFDAIGGGALASQILAAMEAALAQREGTNPANRYGSTTHKQVYVYGGLDRGPTELTRSFGMAWGVSGWLMPNFLARVGPETAARLQREVIEGLHTTFASSYTAEISLTDMLDPAVAAEYARQATGTKYLVVPGRSS